MTGHPQYPERDSENVNVRGTIMPGWFSGRAAIWTGGASPRIIGPFDSVSDAMGYANKKALPGAGFFPYDEPE